MGSEKNVATLQKLWGSAGGGRGEQGGGHISDGILRNVDFSQ